MKNFKYKRIIPFIIVLVLITMVITFTTSFGFFQYSKKSTKINRITTGNLVVEAEIDESSSLDITQSNSFPVSDETGKSYDPYTFKLRNLNKKSVNYVIKLIDDVDTINTDNCSGIQMPKSSLKFELVKNNVVVMTSFLTDSGDNIIDSGVIDGKTTNEYELRIWISQTAGNEISGKHFHGKIEVEITPVS